MVQSEVSGAVMRGLLSYASNNLGMRRKLLDPNVKRRAKDPNSEESKARTEARKSILITLDKQFWPYFFEEKIIEGVSGYNTEKQKSIDLSPERGWIVYPAFSGVLDEIVKRMMKAKGWSIDKACDDIGYQSAWEDFNKAHKIYKNDYLVSDPQLIENATANLWGFMYRPSVMKVESFNNNNRVVFELSDFPDLSLNNCKIIGYWIKGAIHIVKRLESDLKMQYNKKGPVNCRYELNVIGAVKELRQPF